MPEGDTILRAANRIGPALVGTVPEAIATPNRRHALARWPERLGGREVTAVTPYGKHLFLTFAGGWTIHSHLRMSGLWSVYRRGGRWSRPPGRAWLVISTGSYEVVQFDGPVLELMTDGRRRFDRRLQALGPDLLAPELDGETFLRRLRADDRRRTIGEALLDQRLIAGIGNIWKSEGCWEAMVDPWRRLGALADAEALAIVERLRPRMLHAATAPRAATAGHHVYRRGGRPCPRCGEPIRAHGQGDDLRTTWWCPGCQR